MNTDTWIPIAECKPRGVYHVRARNFQLAVFDTVDGEPAFFGVRYKFDDDDGFISGEFHYDTGAPHGTCKPLKLIEMLPEEINFAEARYVTEVEHSRKLMTYLKVLRTRVGDRP